MPQNSEPVVLELASLPREQVGPFLLLGMEKTAARSEVDAHWAQRVKQARKQQIKVPLEDVNWARDALGDAERWVRADVASLNADTAEGLLAALGQRYGLGGDQPGRLWPPLDSEKPLADYRPPAEVPEPQAVRSALAVPEPPRELPGAAALLEALAGQPLDPWAVDLPLVE
jgi:hypothetical protein